jgi:hypothetical protein
VESGLGEAPCKVGQIVDGELDLGLHGYHDL